MGTVFVLRFHLFRIEFVRRAVVIERVRGIVGCIRSSFRLLLHYFSEFDESLFSQAMYITGPISLIIYKSMKKKKSEERRSVISSCLHFHAVLGRLVDFDARMCTKR